MLHHGCQTVWEFQHDAEADGCQKLCTVHHPNYHSIMHGAQGGEGTIPTTTVVQHPYASPEVSELTGGPAVTPMPPVPKLPGMQSDKDILSLVQEEQEGDAEKEADALADFLLKKIMMMIMTTATRMTMTPTVMWTTMTAWMMTWMMVEVIVMRRDQRMYFS